MSEDKIQIFIDAVIRYFKQTAETDVKVGTPYLEHNQSPQAMDYTGIIGISGKYKGCVYFTAPKVLLKHLLMTLGEIDVSADNMIDMVGEVANTLSGNARRELGSEFMISVPVVVNGAPSSIHLPKDLRSYVIPINWKGYSAAVVICFKD